MIQTRPRKREHWGPMSLKEMNTKILMEILSQMNCELHVRTCNRHVGFALGNRGLHNL